MGDWKVWWRSRWAWGAALAVAAVLGGTHFLGRQHRPSRDLVTALTEQLLAAYPFPVSLSPDGTMVLLKQAHLSDFEVLVQDRQTSRFRSLTRSRANQVSLTWSPHSDELLFQADETRQKNFGLYLVSVKSGFPRRLPVPASRSALPRIRWRPDGERVAYLSLLEQKVGTLYVFDPHQPKASIDTVLARAAGLAEFDWSPDGKRLAAVGAREPGVLQVIEVSSRRSVATPVVPGGAIRQLSWSPDGRELLVTARRARRKNVELLRVSVDSGAVTPERSAQQADIMMPYWLPSGRGYLYLEASLARMQPFVWERGREPRPLGSLTGVNTIQGFDASGRAAVLEHEPPIGGRHLLAFDLESGQTKKDLYPTPIGWPRREFQPELVRIPLPQGGSAPAYLWRSGKRGAKLQANIIAWPPRWRGPAFWYPSRQIRLEHGVEIIEPLPNDPMAPAEVRAQAVVAAHRYLRDQLGVPPQGIHLMGASIGCSAILRAMPLLDGQVASAILVGLGPSPARVGGRPVIRTRVLVLNGDQDAFSPRAAREGLEAFLGRKLDSHDGFLVLPEEGHLVQRTSNLAVQIAAQVAWILGDPLPSPTGSPAD